MLIYSNMNAFSGLQVQNQCSLTDRIRFLIDFVPFQGDLNEDRLRKKVWTQESSTSVTVMGLMPVEVTHFANQMYIRHLKTLGTTLIGQGISADRVIGYSSCCAVTIG